MKRIFEVVAMTALLVSAAWTQTGIHVVDSLVLGGEGGWDYLTVDSSANRLYISRGMRVQVVDLLARKVVGEISPTPGVHGIAVNRRGGVGYTSNGRDSTVAVFDLSTFAIRTVINVGARNPDAIYYDDVSSRLFTFNGGSANASVINTATNSVEAKLPLPGKPEFAVSDGRGTVYVNIEDKNEIVAFDSRSLKILGVWPIADGDEPSGLAIDRAEHRLFSVCGNKKMVVLDTETGKVVDVLPIGEGVDGAACDPATGTAFSSNGVGTVTAVAKDGSGHYRVVETIPSHRGARTIAWNERGHELYVLGARYGQPPAPTAERPHPRPSIEPGSVTLYILGR